MCEIETNKTKHKIVDHKIEKIVFKQRTENKCLCARTRTHFT